MRSLELTKGWIAKWRADSDLVQLVPGGIHSTRQHEGVDYPYALLSVKLLNRVWQSGTQFASRYEVVTRIYGTEYLGTESEITQLVANLFDHRIDMTVADARVMQVLPQDAGEETEVQQETHYGKDVLLCKQKWVVLMGETQNKS